MKSLYSSINNFLHDYESFYQAASSSVNLPNNSVLQIQGLQGCLFSYFIKELSSQIYFKNLQTIQYSDTKGKNGTQTEQNTSQDLLIIVPGEYEMNNLRDDLETIFPEAELYIFPSWGVIPYRPAAKGSVVFGQRAGFL